MEINFRHFHQIKISWRVLFFECVSFGMLDVLDGKCWTYTFLNASPLFTDSLDENRN